MNRTVHGSAILCNVLFMMPSHHAIRNSRLCHII
jgi:hypothetical protein